MVSQCDAFAGGRGECGERVHMLGSWCFELQGMQHYSTPHRTCKALCWSAAFRFDCCVLRWISWRTNNNCQLLWKLDMICGKIFTKLGLFALEKGRLRGDSESSSVCYHEQEIKVFSMLLGCKARHKVFKLLWGIQLRHHWKIYCLWILKQRSGVPGSVVESLSTFKNRGNKQLAEVMG